MIQWIFKIQSILASFIVNHVISINLITLVHTDALIPIVTTPTRDNSVLSPKPLHLVIKR
jgi:hypothetical protein